MTEQMRLIPLILDWPGQHGTIPPDGTMKRGAGSLAWSVKLLFDRQTGRSMQFKTMADNPVLPPFVQDPNMPDIYANVVDMSGMAYPIDAAGKGLWDRGLVRQTDDDWWNVGLELNRLGYDTSKHAYLCWINGNPSDNTGIGGPHWTGSDTRWNEQSDPNLGGYSLNGRKQIDVWVANNGTGREAYRMLLYAAHEHGHALGEQHSGWVAGVYPNGRPNEIGFSDTLMGYGYNFIANGQPDIRTMKYRAGLLLDDQMLRLREHAIFIDPPELATPFDAGLVDSIMLRKDGLVKLFEELSAGKLTAQEAIARINVGPTQIER